MDSIIYNGSIYTLDKNRPQVEAMAIKDGRIAALGSFDDMVKLRSEGTELVDLNGKTAVPGFNDSHMHLLSYAVDLEKADLTGSESLEQMIDTVQEYITEREIPEGEWVQGSGWIENNFSPVILPSRHDLDRISDRHPIILTRGCCSIAVANTRALELAGLMEKPLKTINGGSIDVDEEGFPTGILRENARLFIYDIIPKIGKDEIKKLILKGQQVCLELGLTSIQSDDFKIWDARYQDILDAYFELDRDNQLDIRVNGQLRLQTMEKLEEFLQLGYRTGDGSEFFKIGPLKLLPDGSLGGRTAALRQPYSDDPGNKGISTFSQAQLDALLEKGHVNGLQLSVHAIGDHAMDMVMESYEKIIEKHPAADPRFRIIHCQITPKDLLERFKKNEIVADVQPSFVGSDMAIAEKYLGRERIEWSYAWKTMLEMGIHVAGSSDSPCDSLSPIMGIYCAVTRKNALGRPEGGWYPKQKLTVEEAVGIYTMGSAYASFEEKIKGSLVEGKLADLAVLSEDIFTMDPDRIKDLKVEKTIVNGEVVFDSQIFNV